MEYRLLLDSLSCQTLFGSLDKTKKLIEKALQIKLYLRENNLVIEGEENTLKSALDKLLPVIERIKTREILSEDDIIIALNGGVAEKNFDYITTYKGRKIQPKTAAQQEYLSKIDKNIITFGIGPAGTGKTFLAVAKACLALKCGQIERIVLSRPAVEAGEHLGFLPGDLKEKVDPFLRPIYDALYELLGSNYGEKYIDKGIIEVAPLAFMRGRTLDNAFIILDEAQNTTMMQMKMFLTRLGFNSKMVVTGDLSQTDVGKVKDSGLYDASVKLCEIDEIGFQYFTKKDVVRHRLVSKIVEAYEKQE